MVASSGERTSPKQVKNRALVYRALTDVEFRRQLLEAPARALGVKELSSDNKKEIGFILAAVRGIEAQIGMLADQLLCANGGPCGIA